ncbi:hypothetical protein [Roseibium sp.]|uniref:hypothetical protein n=1 Tax=Roseibium sp. TaxID=1936156 RepID=UPI003B502DC2
MAGSFEQSALATLVVGNDLAVSGFCETCARIKTVLSQTKRIQILKTGPWIIALGFVAAGFIIFEGPRADAQTQRPDVRSMTCSQAKALVQKQGTVNFATGPNSWTQVKAGVNYCADRAVSLTPVFAPTKDNPQCQVGFTCTQMRYSTR